MTKVGAFDSAAFREMAKGLTAAQFFGAPTFTSLLRPPAANNEGGLLFDTTLSGLEVSNGTLWLTLFATALQANLQSFTSTGTYRPTNGMKYCLVITTGAGGGGGGATALNPNNGAVGVGSGAGGGGTVIGLYSAATIGNSQAVTVSNAGSSGAAAGGSGGIGGSTIFGALQTGLGGGGGTGSGAAANQTVMKKTGGAGGSGTGGNLVIPGGDGFNGIVGSCDGTTDVVLGMGGPGGSSFFTLGKRGTGIARSSLSTAYTGGGSGFTNYGTGGDGATALNNSNTGGSSGGSGAKGLCVILEFF